MKTRSMRILSLLLLAFLLCGCTQESDGNGGHGSKPEQRLLIHAANNEMCLAT